MLLQLNNIIESKSDFEPNPTNPSLKNNLLEWLSKHDLCERHWRFALRFEPGFKQKWQPTLGSQTVNFLDKANLSERGVIQTPSEKKTTTKNTIKNAFQNGSYNRAAPVPLNSNSNTTSLYKTAKTVKGVPIYQYCEELELKSDSKRSSKVQKSTSGMILR